MKSPNIVLIMADQLAPQFTGAYGHPVVKTPAMDRLAERGCRFDAAYTPSPQCAPARYSMLSGRFPMRIGAYDNAAEFSSAIPTFAHYLRLMGYHTCLAGKMHFIGPDQLHGFEERLTTDVYPADYAWTPDWRQADERNDKWYHNMDSVAQSGIAATTYQIEFDDEVGFHAIRRLFDYARHPDSQPFLLAAAFIHPHDPYVARRQWWDLYDADDIDMPVIRREDCFSDAHSQRLIRDNQVDAHAVTDDQVRSARRAYYANVSYFDHWISRFVETLEETGLDGDTIMVVTSDHGDMLGERGLWYKMNFFEHSARVPLIMAGPGIDRGAISTPCSLVDLLPTFLDFAERGGKARPAAMVPYDGASVVPLMEGSADESRMAISEYGAESVTNPMYMLRKGDLKYVHCQSDPPMLFDLAADPHELANVAASAEHAEVAAQFEKEVAERWDCERIRRDILASQASRLVVNQAMQRGALTSWDHQPVQDAANSYVRNHIDWTVQAARSRFPAL